jgi:hypothetical protein
VSKRRADRCGDPGPYAAHCTDYPGHRYSCYDAGEDVSFNRRQDWTHDCGNPECPDDRRINEGD